MLRKNFPGRKLKRREAAEARKAEPKKEGFKIIGKKEQAKNERRRLEMELSNG